MRHVEAPQKKSWPEELRTGERRRMCNRKPGRKLSQAGGDVKAPPGPCDGRKLVLDSQFRFPHYQGARMSNDQRTVNIEIGDKEWEGVYANFVIITHSGSEFVLDFARMLPGAQKAKVFSRIITTPQHAKALLGALEQNIKRYEADHGEIKLVPNDMPRGPIGFQPPKKD
jgi:hypothetical protein